MVAMTFQPIITERYQLGQLLGSGGMGSVYLAHDLRLRRDVAIKVCSTRNLPPAEAQSAADLFATEALTLARLHHPNLTAVWDYFHQDSDWFLVMEYVPGQTLRNLLRGQGGKLPAQQALEYAGQLSVVLTYLHSHTPPVVFRDLKPSNIMVTPDGTLKLIDFGIARLFSPGKAADTAQFGTPGYAPPEQYGGQTEPRSDVYSLGVVVHQMLTGYNPLGNAFTTPLARSLDPTLSPAVEEVLARATSPELAQRFPSVADFLMALRRALGSAQPAARPTQPVVTPAADTPSRQPLWSPAPRHLPAPPSEAGTGRGLLVAALILVVVGSLAAGGWLLRGQVSALSALFQPPAPSPAPFTLPGTLVYAAPGKHGSDSEDLWLREGSQLRALTSQPAGSTVALPALAPDRQRIAYTLDLPTGQQLWLFDRRTNQSRQLLAEYPIARAAAWSPDGRELAVEIASANMTVGDRDIVILNVTTGEQRKFVDGPKWEGGPAWSPDGQQIAFHAIYGDCMLLYVKPVSGGAARQLTDAPRPSDCQRGQGDYWPTWSPNGQQIAFGRKFGSVQRVSVLDLATGQIKTWDTDPQPTNEAPLPGRPRPAGHPRWAPDGQSLLFEEGAAEQSMLSQLNLVSGEIVTVPNTQGGHLADWR